MRHALSVLWVLLPDYAACCVRIVDPPLLLYSILCPYHGPFSLIMRYDVSVLWALLPYNEACFVRIVDPPLL